MIARVQPLTRTRAVRGPFDYAVPDAMAGEVAVGSLLRVPFSRRRELGVVVELADRSELEPDRLAEPERMIGAGIDARARRARGVDGAGVLLDDRRGRSR